MNKKMMKAFYLMGFLLMGLTMSAQHATHLVVTEIEDDKLSELIGNNVSNLLTTFNVAEFEKKALNLDKLDITDDAKNNIIRLWADCPFTCLDNQIVERAVLQPSKEYQIRKIHLVMKPIAGRSKDISWKRYQEGVVTVDASGCITNFHLALDIELYINVLSSAKSVEDLERRMLIYNYVERFRNAYNMKDMPFLEQIYSEDALIITGKVIKSVKRDEAIIGTVSKERIEYSKQSKKEYLTKLAKVFDNNEHIEVSFETIKVVRHPARAEFYGVTLKQLWKSSGGYEDVGWLFLLWDFSNPDMPQIHVRTWQPDEYQGKPLPEKEVFSLDDFDC